MAKDESTSFQHGNTGFNICCVPGISDGLTINSLSKMSHACTSSPCQNLVLHLFAWRDSVPYCLTRLETKLDRDLMFSLTCVQVFEFDTLAFYVAVCRLQNISCCQTPVHLL